jgi:DNA polymerase
MSMAGPLHPWRDTLLDLGVIGLVPTPIARDSSRAVPSCPILGQVEQERDKEKNRMNVSSPAPGDPRAFPPPERVGACATLADLDQAINGCLACPLGAGRIKFVFGEGGGESGMMFIGEGPGREEDLKGRPFVGRAGELLDKMLVAIGLDRSRVYIANVVKCRPPDNRTPTPAEAQRCLPYLRRQIELLRPRVIVTLGATPLRELLGVHAGITRVRGQWQRLEMLGGIPVMPTFHPAYVLRQYTQEVRRAVWNDLLAARKWLDGADRP